MVKKIYAILWYWIPVALWMVIIFSLSSIKGDELPRIDIPNVDKLFHFVEYFVLGAILVRAFSNSFKDPRYMYILFASILISSLYGCLDEFHQRFVSERTPDIFDLLSDIAGSALGAGLSLYRERVGHAHN